MTASPFRWADDNQSGGAESLHFLSLDLTCFIVGFGVHAVAEGAETTLTSIAWGVENRDMFTRVDRDVCDSYRGPIDRPRPPLGKQRGQANM